MYEGAAAWVEGRGGELQPLQDGEWGELAHPVVGHRQLVLPPLLLITERCRIWIRIRINLRCWIRIQVYKSSAPPHYRRGSDRDPDPHGSALI
jgi:hypothetical protein